MDYKMVQYDYGILGSLRNHNSTSTWLWKILGPLKKCWLRWMESSRLQRVLGFHCFGPKKPQLLSPGWIHPMRLRQFTTIPIGIITYSPDFQSATIENLSAMDWLSWALHISGTCSVSKLLIAWGDDIAGGPIIRWSGLTSNCGLWHITLWSRVYPFVTLFANWTNQHSIRQEWLETIHNLTENNIIT